MLNFRMKVRSVEDRTIVLEMQKGILYTITDAKKKWCAYANKHDAVTVALNEWPEDGIRPTYLGKLKMLL